MSVGTMLSALLSIVISLAFIAVLAVGVLWLLKRFQDGSFGRLSGTPTGRTLRFEKALPIGPRERLVLVEIDGEHLLLGVTAHQITPIKSWPIERDSPDEQPVPPTDDSPLTASARRFRLRMANPDSAK